jgi:hypothetical protein
MISGLFFNLKIIIKNIRRDAQQRSISYWAQVETKVFKHQAQSW